MLIRVADMRGRIYLVETAAVAGVIPCDDYHVIQCRGFDVEVRQTLDEIQRCIEDQVALISLPEPRRPVRSPISERFAGLEATIRRPTDSELSDNFPPYTEEPSDPEQDDT